LIQHSKQSIYHGCSVIIGDLGVANRSLSLVVAWNRVVLERVGVVGWGRQLGGVVLGSLGVRTDVAYVDFVV
jgi:hypothetical protein